MCVIQRHKILLICEATNIYKQLSVYHSLYTAMWGKMSQYVNIQYKLYMIDWLVYTQSTATFASVTF
jgi:hypothetical protein